MKIETFTYVKNNTPVGYGAVIRDTEKGDCVVIPKDDRPYFKSEEEARNAAKEVSTKRKQQ